MGILRYNSEISKSINILVKIHYCTVYVALILQKIPTKMRTVSTATVSSCYVYGISATPKETLVGYVTNIYVSCSRKLLRQEGKTL
jgi:hypothetical protein